jgi:hypothetical protein
MGEGTLSVFHVIFMAAISPQAFKKYPQDNTFHLSPWINAPITYFNTGRIFLK